MRIRNRRELAGHFEDRMSRSYAELLDGQRLEPQLSLVKTYMIEGHVGGGGQHDGLTGLLGGLTGTTGPFKEGQATLAETEEDSFVRLAVRTRYGMAELYVDASDPRFWLVHSLDRSSAVDWCVGRLVTSAPELDRAWLPASLLEVASDRGAFRGLGLDYDRRGFAEDGPGEQGGVTYLKMQLWGDRAKGVLTMLRDGGFANETTLAKVKVKYWMDGDEGAFTINDMKYDGKVTARGTSFQCHLALTNELYRRYAGIVTEVERRARVRWIPREGRALIEGGPVHFQFDKHVRTGKALCDYIFRASHPFRLWGVPLEAGPDYYRVSGVDLHVGQPVDFEVTKDWMRVYLHPETCGNTVVRLLTNFQHSVDAQTEAMIDGEPVSRLQPTDD